MINFIFFLLGCLFMMILRTVLYRLNEKAEQYKQDREEINKTLENG